MSVLEIALTTALTSGRFTRSSGNIYLFNCREVLCLSPSGIVLMCEGLWKALFHHPGRTDSTRPGAKGTPLQLSCLRRSSCPYIKAATFSAKPQSSVF